MTRRAAPIDRIPWDAPGIDLRLQDARLGLSYEDRAYLVGAVICLGSTDADRAEIVRQMVERLRASKRAAMI